MAVVVSLGYRGYGDHKDPVLQAVPWRALVGSAAAGALSGCGGWVLGRRSDCLNRRMIRLSSLCGGRQRGKGGHHDNADGCLVLLLMLLFVLLLFLLFILLLLRFLLLFLFRLLFLFLLSV